LTRFHHDVYVEGGNEGKVYYDLNVITGYSLEIWGGADVTDTYFSDIIKIAPIEVLSLFFLDHESDEIINSITDTLSTTIQTIVFDMCDGGYSKESMLNLLTKCIKLKTFHFSANEDWSDQDCLDILYSTPKTVKHLHFIPCPQLNTEQIITFLNSRHLNLTSISFHSSNVDQNLLLKAFKILKSESM
jgi:hypothetical protein